MRLAFVAPPNSIHTRRWAGWFARAGHDVSIVDPVGVQLLPGLPEEIRVVHPVAPARRLPLLGPLDRRGPLRTLLRNLRPDVVHGQYLARFAWAAALAGVHPLVVSPWGSDLLQVGRGRLRTRLWNRFALRRADVVTVSSEGMRAAAVAAGARPDRIRLVRHGVDTSVFTPGPPSESLRVRIGAGGGPVIVSPRTVARLYHQEVVLEAVARLDGRPVMVVSATGADPQALSELRGRAASAGMGDRLRVVEGLAPEELPDLYRIADVVVSVPETDSFAVTLLEAMACGRPLVVSDLPAVGPVLASVDPLARELTVPVGDVRATTASMQRALSMSDGERHRLGTAFRQHVIATAEYDTNMAAMEAIYRELVVPHR